MNVLRQPQEMMLSERRMFQAAVVQRDQLRLLHHPEVILADEFVPMLLQHRILVARSVVAELHPAEVAQQFPVEADRAQAQVHPAEAVLAPAQQLPAEAVLVLVERPGNVVEANSRFATESVSTFVVMDWVQRLALTSPSASLNSSFNPCCDGLGSKTALPS